MNMSRVRRAGVAGKGFLKSRKLSRLSARITQITATSGEDRGTMIDNFPSSKCNMAHSSHSVMHARLSL